MYLEALKQEEKFGLCCWRLNDKEKGTTNAFQQLETNKQVVSSVFKA